MNILKSDKWSKNVSKIEHFKPKQVLQPGIFGYPVTKYTRLQHYDKFRSPPVHVHVIETAKAWLVNGAASRTRNPKHVSVSP